jgi:transcription initiation factor TFIIIB Brf1 subunit/transcription initiation factor TFIIB
VDNNTFICPLCKKTIFVYEDEMLICRNCGTVVYEDRGYGKPDKYNKLNLYRVDHDGKIGRLGYQIQLNYEYYLYKMRREIKILGEILGIPKNIIDDAITLATRISSSNPKISRRLISIISIVYSCRVRNYPLSYKELSRAMKERFGMKIKRRRLFKAIRKLCETGITSKKIEPLNLTTRFLTNIINDSIIINKLREAEMDTMEYYREMIREMKNIYNKYRIFFQGKPIKTVAALLLYLSDIKLSNMKKRTRLLTQRYLAEITGVSSFTIRERARDFYKYSNDPIYRVKKR